MIKTSAPSVGNESNIPNIRVIVDALRDLRDASSEAHEQALAARAATRRAVDELVGPCKEAGCTAAVPSAPKADEECLLDEIHNIIASIKSNIRESDDFSTDTIRAIQRL